MSNLKSLQDAAWIYYSQWSKTKTYSKALKGEVAITRKGWNHLRSGSKSKRRSISDKIRRLGLLKQARYVIEHATTFTVGTKATEKHFILQLSLPGKKQKVKVIIKKDKKGRYYFFSVM